MGYGQWGEWHTMWSDYPWPDKDIKHKVLTKIIQQSWINRNAGWCVKQFPLKIYLTDKNGNEKFSVVDHAFDISKLYKGEYYSKSTMVGLSNKLAAGEYDLRIALVDDTGNPSVKLTIEGIDKLGRYKLGTIKILHSN